MTIGSWQDIPLKTCMLKLVGSPCLLRSRLYITLILTSTFLRRWENALCIARANGVHRLLLGAWGCGAFGGDPQMAATTAKQAIARFGSAFDEIVFAIPSAGKESLSNLNVFRTVFSE